MQAMQRLMTWWFTLWYRNMALEELHHELRFAMVGSACAAEIQAILDLCPDPECHECGEIMCPYLEPLHFHHDGCPACAERQCA